jgi:GT2 family glycosyltransferase
MPRLSIITPVFDPIPDHLVACLASVDQQTSDDWEHVVVDDASSDPEIVGVLDSWPPDPRRTFHRRVDNGGIVAASNDAVERATGGFVVMLDHDDVLAPEAVQRLVEAVVSTPEADVLYSDHDLLRSDDRAVSPVYKPDFSPERLLNHNYITHLVAIRRELVVRLGAFRAGFDGAQDHDLLLRATEVARTVQHLPEVLLHWRQSPASVAADIANKPDAFDAGRRAVADALRRRGIEGTVDETELAGVYRIRRDLLGTPTVSVVIPTRGSRGRVWGCERIFVHHAVASLLADRSSRCRLEFVVVADQPLDSVVERGLRMLAGERLVLVPFDQPFNFSAKVDAGARAATGDYLLILNDDTELIEPASIDEMVGIAQEPDVGLVGAKLLYGDGTLQHGGHVYNHTIDHALRGWDGAHPGPQHLLAIARECAGVTAAAALVRRDVYDEVGGMDPSLPVNYNDVDLSLRVRRSGRRIVWTPHACWYHFESRSAPHPIEPREIEQLLERWPDALHGDPYYNPNLAPGRTDWLERPGRSGAPPFVVLADGSKVWG